MGDPASMSDRMLNDLRCPRCGVSFGELVLNTVDVEVTPEDMERVMRWQCPTCGYRTLWHKNVVACMNSLSNAQPEQEPSIFNRFTVAQPETLPDGGNPDKPVIVVIQRNGLSDEDIRRLLEGFVPDGEGEDTPPQVIE